MRNLTRFAILSTALCAACPRAGGTGGTTPESRQGQAGPALELPEQVTEGNVRALVRALRASAAGAPGRLELRRMVLAHQSDQLERALADRQPDRAFELFDEALGLYAPSELVAGGLEPVAAGMARRVLEAFEPRGDEARVLAALLVLNLAEPSERDHEARYREVARWADEVRQSLPSQVERTMGLVAVYERVTEVVPAEEPVDRLAALYLRRHSLLRSTFDGPGALGMLLSRHHPRELESLAASQGRTVADIVALLVRSGREDEVRRTVAVLGPLREDDQALVAAARDLRTERRGARARTLLAGAFGRHRPEVALMLCHEGRRLFPRDRNFPGCLAELYRAAGDADGALEYYEATLELDGSRETFEVALSFVATELEAQLADEDPQRVRETYERAERILAAFSRQHPGREPPIREDQLSYLVGMGEFNAGNIDEAVARLEASVAARPSRPALVQLGVIAERRGRHEEAARRFRLALDLQEGPRESPLSRAVVLAHLAGATRLGGAPDRARVLYEEALIMLRDALRTMPADAAATIRIEQGIVLHALGRSEEAVAELRQALTTSPQRQSTYGRVLSFLVSRGLVEEAAEVYRRAFTSSELDRIWKIYFSIWLVGLQQRLGRTPDATATRFLDSIEGEDWVERLGRYYAGDLTYEALLEGAETRGQRAEAYYYEAVLRLAQGDRERAAALLGQVLETDMMGYFEYDFARQLRGELAGGAPPAAAARGR